MFTSSIPSTFSILNIHAEKPMRLGCDYATGKWPVTRGSIPSEDRHYLFTVSRSTLGPTQPIQSVPEDLFPGVQRTVGEVDCLHESTAEVKNTCSYTAIPPLDKGLDRAHAQSGPCWKEKNLCLHRESNPNSPVVHPAA
jgi:hypothetical protein